MNKFSLPAAMLICLTLSACHAEKAARDTAAALNGALVGAQTKYQAACKANPAQVECTLINKGVDAQNALVTAIQTYCGWSATTPPSNPGTACVPVASALAGMNQALANANTLIPEIKGIVR